MIESRVKAAMEGKGMTVRELSSVTGIAPRTIMRARGPLIARCTLETLASIAGALGVKTKDLYEEG
jgi:transcriptional regulator with XRE-family HTH domain